jgi:hypothetical protein
VVKAKAKAKRVINSEKMSKEDSVAMVEEYQDKLQLTASQFKRWACKRYLVLIEVEEAEQLKPFPIDKSEYGNMDDWLPVEDIQSVME